VIRKSSIVIVVGCVAALLVGYWARSPFDLRDASAATATSRAKAPRARTVARTDSPPLAGRAMAAPPAPRQFERAELPKPDANARHRVWVESQYGSSLDQLGLAVPSGEGEIYPPQGFASTPDGKLVVLDSAKRRLVWYGKDGRIEKTRPVTDLVMPADVAITADGTIVVIDHEGVQTKGTLLLDADGNKKAELPQLKDGLMTGMYTVGNDVYITKEGIASAKVGDTTGSGSDEIGGLYNDNGVVPGQIAPDGRTVINAGIDNEELGNFFVSALRGPEPEHVFSRHYRAPGRLLSIPFVQSDAKGDVYVVLYYDDSFALMCVDGSNGDPKGLVPLPSPEAGTGTPFRLYSVMSTGGLVYQRLQKSGSTFEVYDCN
jgi:hypothetical protein